MLKKANMLFKVVLAILIIYGFSDNLQALEDPDTKYDDRIVSFTVLQTSGLSNHANGWGGPSYDYTPYDNKDNDRIYGGFSRLATLIKGVREEQSGIPVLLFDSGDFSMGDIYDLAVDNPVALEFFQAMGYDGIIIGDQELYHSPKGLALLIQNASDNGFSVPIISSDMSETMTDLKPFVQKDMIIDLINGLKAGILGLMGTESEEAARLDSEYFIHDYDYIQNRVDELMSRGADIIIALSHGGINSQEIGEDADLAENVKGIDIILSGNCESEIRQPIQVSNSLILASGMYGKFLGRLDLKYDISKKKIFDYSATLIPVHDAIPGDMLIQNMIEQKERDINLAISSFGLDIFEDVANIDFDLKKDKASLTGETGIGNLAADSVLYAANKAAEGSDNTDRFDFAAVIGIKDSIYKGKSGIVRFADIYRAMPFGSIESIDSLPKYPIISFYITGKELRRLCEGGLSLSPMLGENYFINFSGINIKYDISKASYLDGVSEIYLCSDYETSSCTVSVDLLDDQKLYRGAADIYAIDMIKMINSTNLSIALKDKDRNVIDIEDRTNLINFMIDADPSTSQKEEIKAWKAMLDYITQLPARQIPEYIYDKDDKTVELINVTK